MRSHRVRALLMGGQACVFYGAAEFSRDTDLAIVANSANLTRLRGALADLRAEPIAVPPIALDYFQHLEHPNSAQIRFWLLELRTPELLTVVARGNPLACHRLASQRPLLSWAISGDSPQLESALLAEETAERERDREYWLPLRRELESLRHAQRTLPN